MSRVSRARETAATSICFVAFDKLCFFQSLSKQHYTVVGTLHDPIRVHTDLSVVKFFAMALDREELLIALWHGVAEAPATFACGGAVDGAKHQLPRSLWLEGLGDLPLPLSLEDVSRIRDKATGDKSRLGFGRVADLEKAPPQTWELFYHTEFLRPASGKQFMKTVCGIAVEAVGRLGQNAESLTLEVTPYKLVCYEKGGGVSVNRDKAFIMGGAGNFGRLLLQLPVENGHKGGASVLLRRKDKKKLECSRGSSKGFHFTAFYDECRFRVEEITSGRRVCVVFNLVRRDSRPTPMPRSQGFLDAVLRVEAALLPWVENLKDKGSKGGPQRLFIPLQHKYSDTSFARLLGQDRNVGDLLRFCGGTSSSNGGVALEVFLCTLTKHEVYNRDSRYGVYARDQFHRIDSSVQADGWIGPNDRGLRFPPMDIINVGSDVVMPKGKHDPFSEDDEEPEGLERICYLDEVWYRVAAFLVFTKSGGIGTLVAGCGGMRAALDLVESKQKHRAPETPTYLRQLLDFCTRYPSKVWGKHSWEASDSTCRLLKLCVKTGDCQDVIRLIKILGRTYKSKSGGASWYPGIGGNGAAWTLASVVKSLGWDACGNAIVKYLLLESRFGDEAESFVELALELREQGCHEAALVVARRTFSLVPSALCSLKPGATASVAVLLFSLLHEHIAGFVDKMQAVATSTLTEVVARVVDTDMDQARIKDTDSLSLKKDANLLNHFSKLCHILAANVHCPSLSNPKLLDDVIHSFLWLGDASVLESAVQTALRQSRQGNGQFLLKELMAKLESWLRSEFNPCKDSSMAEAALKTLTAERIRKVSSTPKPAFTWSQPLATLPDFPDVEAFLRGPDQTYCRSRIHSLPEARRFAKKYFNGSYKHGFSALGTPGGRGPDAHCKNEKTDAAYLAMVEAWEDEQKEVVELHSKIAGIDELQFEPPVAKRRKTRTFCGNS